VTALSATHDGVLHIRATQLGQLVELNAASLMVLCRKIALMQDDAMM